MKNNQPEYLTPDERAQKLVNTIETILEDPKNGVTWDGLTDKWRKHQDEKTNSASPDSSPESD